MLTVTNGRIITDDDILEGSNIIIKDGKILGIYDEIPAGSEVLDACGNFVSPGFIDMHIHGANGHDVMDGTFEAINAVSKIIAKHGVTSFMPTTTTMGIHDIRIALKAIKESIVNGTEGANVLGAHIEGPFINVKFKGAHDEQHIKLPDIGLFTEIADEDFSYINRVTIAPEIEGAPELIRFLVGLGIMVSVGHSDGSYDEIINAIGIGASHSTHLYNAMRGFNHREPGVVGSIFDSRISTEIIVDGVHVHYAAVRTALTEKGYMNCALISDSMRAACMEDGTYSFGGMDVFVKEGAARLSNGTLAGSTLTLDSAVKNILKNTSYNIIEAVAMTSSVPARICKINSTKGHIKPGYDADIVVFDPEINIKTTIIGGKIIKS